MGNGAQTASSAERPICVCVEGNLISVEVSNRKETPCVGSVRIILCFEMSFWTPLVTVAVESVDMGLCF